MAGWREVTELVHRAGGRIFLQLWHVGRISHPSLQPDGMLPVAPSSIVPAGEAFIEDESGGGALVPFVAPRALQTEEIPYVVQQYVLGAKNAMSAGFDGVEVHAANGYVLDQFLNSTTNHRTDEYGGSTENRARLLLEVVQAVSDVWEPDRVGVRLSPLGEFNDMCDANPKETIGYVVSRLNEIGLAYLHVVRPRIPEADKGTWDDSEAQSMMRLVRDRYQSTLIVAGGFSGEEAEEWVEGGRADLIAFGRKFLANPDLPHRLRIGATLNADDPTTYYGGGAKGYTDYPNLEQEQGKQPMLCVDERWR